MTTSPVLTSDLLVSDFDFELPPELIAQTPLPERDRSRLLIVDRANEQIGHGSIADLPELLRPGDLVVVNNSRVIPARLHADRESTGGQVELLLLHRTDDGEWSALARPARRVHLGESLSLHPVDPSRTPAAKLTVTGKGDQGLVKLRFADDEDRRLSDYGVIPLPPYIHQPVDDPERYQTIYASVPGSAAAPTAGLHISPALRQTLRDRGVGWAEVTLHIGLDTFRPVTVDRVADHHIHSEWCSVAAETAQAIRRTRNQGGRVVAIGTTAARTLETLGQTWKVTPGSGFTGPTDIFITPGYQWTVVDALLTNFHLPRSTLLMMVSSFAGRERILAAYAAAIERQYRFFSFGDAMLIV